jgi:hypothetical protein
MWLALLDRILGTAVIALGLMQCASTFLFFARFEEPAIWFFAGGLLLTVVGALNLLRLRYGATAPGVRYVSLAANLVLSLLWVALYWGLLDKFAQRPASFLGPLIILAASAVSLRDAGRSRVDAASARVRRRPS